MLVTFYTFVFLYQNAHVDFPYPPGVRRDEVRHQNRSEMSEQSVIDDLYNLTESDVASTTEYVYDRSRISYPQNSGSGEISDNDHDFGDSGLDLNPEGSASGEDPMGSANEGVPSEENPDDDDMDAEERDSISNPAGSRGTSWDGVPDDEEYLDEDISNDNEDLKDTFEEKPSVPKKTKYKAGKRKTNKPVAKKSVVVDNNSNTIKKKVQVAAEETATQRVQVNAGYENPEIPCLGNGCSGVLLKWVLTFYGTEN